MANHQRGVDIVDAIPGARASLRWGAWGGMALLVVPAVALAAFAAISTMEGGNAALAWTMVAIGLIALIGAGLLMLRKLSSLRRLAELAQALCEHGGPVLVKDARHRYRFANEAVGLLIGRSPAEILGQRDSDLDPGPAALAYEENDRVCLDRGLPTLFRESQQAADGEHVYLIGKYPLHDARGRISGLVGVARDITDELELQKVARRRADEMRVWFDRNPLPVVTFAAADHRIIDANAAAARCYGRTRDQLLKLRLSDLFAPDEADRLQAYLRREGRAIPPGSVAWKHRKASGELFDALTDMGNLPHAEVPAHVMLVRDVSAERTAQEALRLAEANYEELIESGVAVVWAHDLDGRLLRVNAVMAETLGQDRERLVGRMLSAFIADDSRLEWNEYIERTRSLGRDTGLLHVVGSGGQPRVWQYRSICFPDATPVPYILGMAQDVTTRHRYELRMRDQARRDPLTGCRTRRYLDALAVQATPSQVWGCVVVDVDHFRELNATAGRDRGDQALRDVARLLGGYAGPGDEVIRTGGDDFAIVLPRTTVAAVRALAGRLHEVARAGDPATFSLGWAVREAGEPLESTLRRADKMLLRDRTGARG